MIGVVFLIKGAHHSKNPEWGNSGGSELGVSFDFTPVLDTDAFRFYFVPEQGFVPAFNQLKLPSYETQYLQAIAAGELASSEVLKCYKLLMRQVINSLLGDKPLHSRKLFAKKTVNIQTNNKQ